MRRLLILLSLVMVLLAACAPALPASSGDSQEEPVDNPSEQPTAEQPDPGERFDFDTETSHPAVPVDAPIPELIWDNDPENVVISATYCCGFVPVLSVTNYIPDVTIYGNGRIIWTVLDDQGGRQVFEAQLSPETVESLLAQIAAAGFFGWQDRYQDPTVSDLADQCLQVNLAGVSKSVCEYHKGAPAAFHELYDFLAKGAGEEGALFVPETAFLTVESMGSDLDIGDQKVTALDETALSISLAKAEEGLWIEGPALARLWQEVNARPWFPLVEAGGDFFQLGLQIPGLSLVAPPPK